MKVDLFKRAIEIIEAIPEEKVYLNNWQSFPRFLKAAQTLNDVRCGTLACAGGWLALHPDMQTAGLFASGSMGVPSYRYIVPGVFKAEVMHVGYVALAVFFEIPRSDAAKLFGRAEDDELYAGITTHKQIWLKRARTYLANYEAKQ